MGIGNLLEIIGGYWIIGNIIGIIGIGNYWMLLDYWKYYW